MYGYNYYQAQMPSPTLKGRPVSSLDEVKATPIDFDGSISYFPDLANRCIYTKNINLDGTASLQVYELKVAPIAVQEAKPDYVTRDDLNAAIDELKKSMAAKPAKAVKVAESF